MAHMAVNAVALQSVRYLTRGTRSHPDITDMGEFGASGTNTRSNPCEIVGQVLLAPFILKSAQQEIILVTPRHNRAPNEMSALRSLASRYRDFACLISRRAFLYYSQIRATCRDQAIGLLALRTDYRPVAGRIVYLQQLSGGEQ
jgi:hypothetical protein